MFNKKQIKKFIRKNPLAALGIVLCLGWCVLALLAPVISPFDPVVQDLAARNQAPNALHWFGTDRMGRDILSRTLYGARISLPAGMLVVIFATVLGGAWGAIAGYFGKAVDEVMMRISDIIMSFPSILLAMAIAAVLGRNMLNSVLAIVVVWWPKYARMMRSLVLSVKESEYVTAAVALGESPIRVLARTIVPNCVSPLLVMGSVDLGNAILIFAGLGFLGLGVVPPNPEWGAMVSEGAAILKYWWVSFFPGCAIFMVSMGFNFIGDAIRDALDPRLRNQL